MNSLKMICLWIWMFLFPVQSLQMLGNYLNMNWTKKGNQSRENMASTSGIRSPGVSLAEQCGVPAAVCHIIATHAGEGDMVKRTVEAYIVHHADFMTFEPFRERLK